MCERQSSPQRVFRTRICACSFGHNCSNLLIMQSLVSFLCSRNKGMEQMNMEFLPTVIDRFERRRMEGEGGGDMEGGLRERKRER